MTPLLSPVFSSLAGVAVGFVPGIGVTVAVGGVDVAATGSLGSGGAVAGFTVGVVLAVGAGTGEMVGAGVIIMIGVDVGDTVGVGTGVVLIVGIGILVGVGVTVMIGVAVAVTTGDAVGGVVMAGVGVGSRTGVPFFCNNKLSALFFGSIVYSAPVVSAQLPSGSATSCVKFRGVLICDREVQPLSILAISVTFEVSKLPRSSWDRDVQPLNI